MGLYTVPKFGFPMRWLWPYYLDAESTSLDYSQTKSQQIGFDLAGRRESRLFTKPPRPIHWIWPSLWPYIRQRCCFNGKPTEVKNVTRILSSPVFSEDILYLEREVLSTNKSVCLPFGRASPHQTLDCALRGFASCRLFHPAIKVSVFFRSERHSRKAFTTWFKVLYCICCFIMGSSHVVSRGLHIHVLWEKTHSCHLQALPTQGGDYSTWNVELYEVLVPGLWVLGWFANAIVAQRLVVYGINPR